MLSPPPSCGYERDVIKVEVLEEGVLTTQGNKWIKTDHECNETNPGHQIELNKI